jgi:signal transduction histidine kinase
MNAGTRRPRGEGDDERDGTRVRLLPRSLRARVTLVFCVGAGAALGLCLALLFVAMDRQLTASLDSDLRSRGADLVAAVNAGDTGVVDRDPLAQLYAADGGVIAGSPSLRERRLLAVDEVRGVGADAPAPIETRTLPSGGGVAPTEVRLLALPVDGGRVLGVGVSVGPLQDARQRLLVVLLVAAPLLLAALGTGGWLTVRAALRPVDVLTREAAEISSLESDRRLPEVPGDDEIARLAQTLDRMLARLRVAFDRERAFVDDASHELRSPIAVLRGELELALGAAGKRAEVERSLRAALGEAERLSRLADDLLVLARERTGSLVVRAEPVDLLDVAATEARRLAPVLGVETRISGEPAVVRGDADRLRQVIANLVHNSAAAGAGTVRVRVARDRAFAIVEIADDGPGFPPGLLDSAFDRFVRGRSRAHAARVRGGPGPVDRACRRDRPRGRRRCPQRRAARRRGRDGTAADRLTPPALACGGGRAAYQPAAIGECRRQ